MCAIKTKIGDKSGSYGGIGTAGAASEPSSDLAAGIGTRISAAADALGSRKNAAEVMGISTDSLQRYIREEVQASFAAVARLALASGHSLHWLATGKADAAIASQGLSLEPETLAEAIVTVEAALDAIDRELSPGGRARVVVAVYDYLVDDAQRRSAADVVAFTLRAIRKEKSDE